MIYIIDFENVGPSGFDGHKSLSRDDEVVVFLSPVHTKLDTALLQNSRASFRFIGITPNGHKNYMDFQIVSLCALMIEQHKNITIVSNDMGYSAVQDFFRENVLLDTPSDIKLASNLFGEPVVAPIPKSPPKQTALPKPVPAPKKKKKKSKTVSGLNINDITPVTVGSKQETLQDVLIRLPCTEVQRKTVEKLVMKTMTNAKKNRPTRKKFKQSFTFLQPDIREICFNAVLPFANLKN